MIFQSPGFVEALCSAVANGGSPIDFCAEHKILFSDLSVWMSEDPERQKKYNAALMSRDEWLVQSVLGELKRIFSIDIRGAFDDNGCLIDIKKLSPELASVISSVEVFEEFSGRGNDRKMIGYTKKIKFWDKVRAIELQMKNLSLLIERHEHNVHGQVTVMPDIKLDNGNPLRFDLGAIPPEN